MECALLMVVIMVIVNDEEVVLMLRGNKGSSDVHARLKEENVPGRSNACTDGASDASVSHVGKSQKYTIWLA